MNTRKAWQIFRGIVGKNTTGPICRWINELLLVVLESRELLFVEFVRLARNPTRFDDRKFDILADALLALRTEMGKFVDRWWLVLRFFTPLGQIRMLEALARTPSCEVILSSSQAHRVLKFHTTRKIPGAATLLAKCSNITHKSISQIVPVENELKNGTCTAGEKKQEEEEEAFLSFHPFFTVFTSPPTPHDPYFSHTGAAHAMLVHSDELDYQSNTNFFL